MNTPAEYEAAKAKYFLINFQTAFEVSKDPPKAGGR
jgi:hypothetical protein